MKSRIHETLDQMLHRQAARRRIFNMMFVYRHRCCTRECRALLASPPGSYKTTALCVPAMAAKPSKHPGCPRCRMDIVRFTRKVKLPRFTMRAGEEWDLPQCRYTADGGLELGAGIVPAGSYAIVKVDATRACNCPHTWQRDQAERTVRPC